MTTTETLRHEIEPPSWGVPEVGVGPAIRAHWRLVVLPVILLVGAAAFVGVTRKQVFTAQARLNVGRLDVSTQSIPGYAVGIQSLAVAYARAVTADPVVRAVGAQLHMSPKQVTARVAATPVPLSPLIVLYATGSTERGAVNLANASSNQLVAYLAQVNLANPVGARALADYKTQAAALYELQQTLSDAQSRYTVRPTGADRLAVASASADVKAKALTVQALQSSYLSSQQGLNSAALVQVLNPAETAYSDKRTKEEALGFGALAIGLLLGVALAVSRNRAGYRRALRPPQ